MKHLLKLAIVIAVPVAVVAALVSWPILDEVETGKTPEYRDIVPRDYTSTEATVGKAAKAAVERLSGWQLVGSGSGPGGTEIRAVATSRLPLTSDVTIRIRRTGGRTQVSVRSKSRKWPLDLGQNARNIRAFLAELDHTMYLP